MQLATRVQELTPSLTLAIDSKAKALKAEGIDVCGFGAGEPDMDTPEHIKAACIEAIQSGFTKYTPSSGLPELRQAISEKFKKDNNLDYKPSQIIVSNGAKAVLLQRGDRRVRSRRRSDHSGAVLAELSGNGSPGWSRAGHRSRPPNRTLGRSPPNNSKTR